MLLRWKEAKSKLVDIMADNEKNRQAKKMEG